MGRCRGQLPSPPKSCLCSLGGKLGIPETAGLGIWVFACPGSLAILPQASAQTQLVPPPGCSHSVVNASEKQGLGLLSHTALELMHKLPWVVDQLRLLVKMKNG